MIVCKKADEWYIDRHRMTTIDNEWQQVVQRMAMSDTSDIEWHNEWQRVIQRVTRSGTARDNEWQRMTTITKNDNEWRRMTASDKTNEYEWE